MPPFAAVVATAWTVLLVAHVSGSGDYLHHDAVLDGGRPSVLALGAFLLGWMAMVVAMMIPATWPVFARRSSADRGADPSPAGFLGGFLLVWGLAGAGALALDSSLHQAVHGVPALEARPWLVMTAVLAIAGVAKMLPWTVREHSALHPFPIRREASGSGFVAGRDLGVRCLRADGPLMLVMFAVGGGMLWMIPLTVVMVVERLPRWHKAVAIGSGLALLAAAVATVALSV